MKIWLTSLLFLFWGASSFAQKLNGLVLDIDNHPISHAKILDEDKKLIIHTDSSGHFQLDQKRYPIFGVEKYGYTSRWYKIGDQPRKTMTVILDYYYQELESVEVTDSRPEDALDISSVNILDYQPFGSKILTLKRDKKTYYIGIDSIGVTGPRYEFYQDRPRRLFLDCMGNMHVVCSERVYQIAVVKDSLLIVDEISKSTFNKYLEPCIAKFGDKIVMKELSHHNQVYDLSIFEKGEKTITFFRQIDEITGSIAAEEALQLEFSIRGEFLDDSLSNHTLDIRRYLRQIHNGENPDVNLEFIRQNKKNGGGWAQRMGTYMMLSYPIDVRSFQMNDYVSVVDFEIDSVSIYNSSGAFVQSAAFSVSGDIKEVWQDNFSNDVYLYTREGGNHMIYYLDVLTGNCNFLKSMKNLRLSETEKIYNGWLYYREIDNGFFQINRVRLPAH